MREMQELDDLAQARLERARADAALASAQAIGAVMSLVPYLGGAIALGALVLMALSESALADECGAIPVDVCHWLSNGGVGKILFGAFVLVGLVLTGAFLAQRNRVLRAAHRSNQEE